MIVVSIISIILSIYAIYALINELRCGIYFVSFRQKHKKKERKFIR